MSGPYATHQQAIDAVPGVRDWFLEKHPLGRFLEWATVATTHGYNSPGEYEKRSR